MILTKVFDEEHEEDLQNSINDFMQEEEYLEIIDIKFSTAIAVQEEEQLYCFSALIIYRI